MVERAKRARRGGGRGAKKELNKREAKKENGGEMKNNGRDRKKLSDGNSVIKWLLAALGFNKE